MSDTARREYVRPAEDQPLDELQLELVQMWADIIEAKLREELAAEHQAGAAVPPTEGEGCP